MTMRVDVLTEADEQWDELLLPNVDPMMTGALVRAACRREQASPLQISVETPTWRGCYVVLIQESNGVALARTPTHGGPWIDGCSEPALSELRSVTDEVLLARGVVSEVIQLSPWAPGRQALARAWALHEGREIWLTDTERELGSLAKGRRSDIARSVRDQRWSWRPLDRAGAHEFSERYERAMRRSDAIDRWRRRPEYFEALVSRRASVFVATAEGDDGGASALFARSGVNASYLYACRWGTAGGAPSRVVWAGLDALAAMGVSSCLLGGGTTDDLTDPLLRFKRSLGTTPVRHLIGARLYDEAGHASAVARDLARPLPEGTVRIDRQELHVPPLG